jgi:hypothetical protein
MASHSSRPSVNLAAGRQVLDEHLPRVLAFKKRTMEELGWRRLSDRSLLVTLRGVYSGIQDDYLLRLDFLTGADWPPSARFVNPETFDYALHSDQHHLPMLASPEVHMHAEYASGDGRTLQLICCSAVYQYYDVSHGGDDSILWRDTDTFLTTVRAIERAFTTHYTGRFQRHAG